MSQEQFCTFIVGEGSHDSISFAQMHGELKRKVPVDKLALYCGTIHYRTRARLVSRAPEPWSDDVTVEVRQEYQDKSIMKGWLYECAKEPFLATVCQSVLKWDNDPTPSAENGPSCRVVNQAHSYNAWVWHNQSEGRHCWPSDCMIGRFKCRVTVKDGEKDPMMIIFYPKDNKGMTETRWAIIDREGMEFV